MTGMPSADGERTILARFLAAVGSLQAPLDPVLETAKSNAQAWLTQLDAPVRIAVAGLPGVGKSSLVNLLSGQEIIPAASSGAPLPTLILRHSTQEETRADWWDQPGRQFDGLDLAAAASEQPDIISVGIDLAALNDVWLVDISGLGRARFDKPALFALDQLADVLVWCIDASAPPNKQERAALNALPDRVKNNIVLVLTNGDKVDPAVLEATVNELKSATPRRFHDVAALSIPQAFSALDGESDDPDALWIDCGAAGMVQAVMQGAIDFRETQIGKITAGIETHIMPFQKPSRQPSALTEQPPEPTAQTAPEKPTVAVAVAPEPEAATEPVPDAIAETPNAAASPVPEGPQNPALESWKSRLNALLVTVDQGGIKDNSEFIRGCQTLVDEQLDQLLEEDLLPDDADWLISDIERANDILILMHFESADHVLDSVVGILAQLSESLSWAGTIKGQNQGTGQSQSGA